MITLDLRNVFAGNIFVEWVFGDVIQGYMNYRKGKQKLDTKMCKFR